MPETITAITEYHGELPDEYGYSPHPEAGYTVTTTEQEIKLAIDDESSCCEKWGYFLSEDDPQKFVGAELRGVSITDTNLTSRTFLSHSWDQDHPENNVDLDSGDTMFVNIETDRGVLQFVAYNAHNGYYGHSARVSSSQLTHETRL